ncbi:ABC transporter substrate-binding protein [Propionimicrobium sp. PCR01-08-3]|uniref:ABC transporter substrate-binding protein n=1 Tax=Propionimicrobium sp. PCR01-08-3 TaxID=3052086 RepID=UPI00255C3EB7|nr:ABC transporter substrate-binding protein [Propionimicrobium sp. PCR01-08-3]WIY82929.1 ABC transporter substrate-binding protein [Propionimicrobium sp. PCR01-08-3]
MTPTKMTRRTFGGLSTLAMASFLAACDRQPAASGGSSNVTYQLSWTHSVQFGGTYVAQDQGLFEGLNVKLAAGGPNVAGDANTVSGAALLNISSSDGVARSNAEGADLVIIGAQYQKSPATILSLAEAPLEHPQDLIGKQIGVAGTDTPGLTAFLATNGLEQDQVQFVPSQYDPAILTAGQVDGIFCFYNDLPVALAVQGIAGYSMLLADFGYNPMSQTYTVRRSSLADDVERDQILRLIRGDARGWQQYREDPGAAAELTIRMNPDAGLDLETQQEQADVQLDIMFSELTDQHGFGWFTDEQIEENLKLFELLGIEGSDEQLWDRSILDEVYRDGPTA